MLTIVFDRAGRCSALSERPAGVVCEPGDDADSASDGVDETFLYDAVARFKERLLANMDAIDTATTAIVAGDVAVLVFAVDKIRMLQPVAEWCALAVLCTSLLLCATAYVFGFQHRLGSREGVRPRLFIADAGLRGKAATFSAIRTQTEAGEANMSICSVKRSLAVTAILFLFIAGAIVMVAGLRGVVY